MDHDEARALAARLDAVGVRAEPEQFSTRLGPAAGYVVHVTDASHRRQMLMHDPSGGFLLVGDRDPIPTFEQLVGRLTEGEVDHRAEALRLAKTCDVATQALVHATLAHAPTLMETELEVQGSPMVAGFEPGALLSDGEALDRIVTVLADATLGYVETMAAVEYAVVATGRTIGQ